MLVSGSLRGVGVGSGGESCTGLMRLNECG